MYIIVVRGRSRSTCGGACKYLLITRVTEKRCSESQLTSEKSKQYKKDKPELDVIQRGEWLTDTHTSTVKEILKKLFPSISGLQNPVYGHNLSFKCLP